MAMTKQELRIILEEGEGYRIEFKERFSDLDREMVAFANASGGRIFLGINDHGIVKGIAISNGLKSRIQDIANNCDPTVKILLEEYEEILIIHVREGSDKPYRCTGGFYTRTGPNSQKLNRDQIIAFIQAEGKVRYDELVKRDFKDKDIDREKVDRFLRMAGISPVLDKPLLYKNLGIGEAQEGRIYYNNLAPLFFAKNLNDFYYHTVVTCALYRGKEKAVVLDRKDYNSDLVSNVDQAMNFIKQYLPVRYEFTGELARKEIPQIPYEALREALINAVIHRDYFEKGANVMIEMFGDRIEITNPGGLVKGLTPENFGKVSMLRNPGIANLFQRIDYIEKMGTGIERIRRALKEAKVPQVRYELMPVFVKAVFTRPEEVSEITTQETAQKTTQKKAQKTTQKRTQKRTQKQQAVLDFLKEHPDASRKDISTGIEGMTENGVKSIIKALQQKALLKHFGPNKGGHWEVIENIATKDGISGQDTTIKKSTQKKAQKTTQKKTQKQQAILDFLKEHPDASRKDIASGIHGMTKNGVISIIKALRQKGLLKHVGPDKGGYWEVNIGDKNE